LVTFGGAIGNGNTIAMLKASGGLDLVGRYRLGCRELWKKSQDT
jgi:hypothetical protein